MFTIQRTTSKCFPSVAQWSAVEPVLSLTSRSALCLLSSSIAVTLPGRTNQSVRFYVRQHLFKMLQSNVNCYCLESMFCLRANSLEPSKLSSNFSRNGDLPAFLGNVTHTFICVFFENQDHIYVWIGQTSRWPTALLCMGMGAISIRHELISKHRKI